MNWAALWDAAPPVPAHALAAFGALLLGVLQLAMPKGTAWHRWMGRLWVLALGFVASSSFFIFELRLIGPFSPIHLVSIYTLISLFWGVRAARRGNIDEHKAAMKSLFWLAIVVTGFFTFIPGRTMYQVLFGG